ncbi:MAG: T9SS type A sorting domain-containing protein [Bacteroidia bacterium]|nr:T9SS type A sorting domain-containing protein [Bacteroidia bacterium]
MKIKTKFASIVWLLWIVTVSVQAQEVVTTSGGYGSSANAKITWTIGEPIIETISGTSAILTQGFNQGDLLLTVIKGPEESGLIIKVYPNPASDHIRLSAGKAETENLKYLLIDMGGKVLTEKNMSGGEADISVSGLAPSTYILKVYQNKKEIGVFKIIKK